MGNENRSFTCLAFTFKVEVSPTRRLRVWGLKERLATSAGPSTATSAFGAGSGLTEADSLSEDCSLSTAGLTWRLPSEPVYRALKFSVLTSEILTTFEVNTIRTSFSSNSVPFSHVRHLTTAT